MTVGDLTCWQPSEWVGQSASRRKSRYAVDSRIMLLQLTHQTYAHGYSNSVMTTRGIIMRRSCDEASKCAHATGCSNLKCNLEVPGTKAEACDSCHQ